MRVGAASLTGLILERLASGRAEAAQQPAAPDQPARAGTIQMLPAPQAAQLLEKVLLADPRFRVFHTYFTKQEMRILPERVQAAMYLAEAGQAAGPPVSPALLAIAPTFRPFRPADRTHEAASIVAIRHGDRVGGVFACQVSVGHRPFQIQRFSIGELSPANEIVWKHIEREEMERLNPTELAKKVGVPPTPTAKPEGGKRRIRPLPAMSDQDHQEVAALVTRALITDRFAKPLYPADGLQGLLRDTGLVQRWALTQSLRYRDLGRVGGGLGISIGSTSTSTSCNGCSSSSSSWSEDEE